jgi:hypothetical protein
MSPYPQLYLISVYAFQVTKGAILIPPATLILFHGRSAGTETRCKKAIKEYSCVVSLDFESLQIT